MRRLPSSTAAVDSLPLQDCTRASSQSPRRRYPPPTPPHRARAPRRQGEGARARAREGGGGALGSFGDGEAVRLGFGGVGEVIDGGLCSDEGIAAGCLCSLVSFTTASDAPSQLTFSYRQKAAGTNNKGSFQISSPPHPPSQNKRLRSNLANSSQRLSPPSSQPPAPPPLKGTRGRGRHSCFPRKRPLRPSEVRARPLRPPTQRRPSTFKRLHACGAQEWVRGMQR